MVRINQTRGPAWDQALEQAGIQQFDDWWQLELEPVEEPNIDRGGWSRVETLSLPGQRARYFVKRQLNHCSRTLRHPLRGEPTLCREFANLQILAEADIGAPEVVYFATRSDAEGQAAILVTRELLDSCSLEDFEPRIIAMSFQRRRQLLRDLAALVSGLHKRGYQHRNLYPKHVFVREGGDGFTLHLIDLETMRRHWGLRRYWLRDIEVLHRRSHYWRNTERIAFLLDYLGEKRLTSQARDIVKALVRRTKHKYEQG